MWLIIYKIGNFLPWISDWFKLSLTTTYSFGPGLFYGILNLNNTDYDLFMSRNLLLTILIFHLSVIFMYLIFIKLKIKNTVSIIISLLMLFSISLYSYWYHLWSTIWNVFTTIVFIYFIITYRSNKNFLKKTSIISWILILFNYFTVFIWIAVLITKLYENIEKQKNSLKIILNTGIKIIKSQMFAILMILFYLLFFYYSWATTHLINYIHSEHWIQKVFINLY